jgi:drug/metabolite transporter (DMT)-like permease
MGNKRLSWFMAVLATVAYSTTPPVARAAIQGGMNPTALLAGRYILTSLLLGLTLRFTSQSQLKIDRRGLWMCVSAGVFNGVTTLAFFWALSRMSASVTSMILSLYPLAVLGLLAWRGERFTLRSAIRCILGILGVYLLLVPGGEMDWIGVLLALIAALSYAVYLVIIQWYLPSYSTVAVSYYTVISMTIVVVGFWLVQGVEWQNPGWQGWAAIIMLAVVGTYLTRLAMFVAVRGIGSAQMALFAPLETFLTIVWSILFLQEKLTLYQWLGGVFIILSALLAIQRIHWPRFKLSWRTGNKGLNN